MKIEERDNAIQNLILIRKKVKETERNFKECVEMIENYKDLLINIKIETLEEKKNSIDEKISIQEFRTVQKKEAFPHILQRRSH